MADFLLGLDPASQTPDLSSTLLVLPGQNAFRLLTDRLAVAGRGVFPPDTATSGDLILFGIEVTPLAPAEQNLLWQKILNEPETDRCDALFLNGLDRFNSKLIAGLAENLTALQTELNRELLSFANAADILQETADYPRWQDLAKLEQRFNALLKKYNLPNPLQQRQDAVSDLTVFRNYERIVIAGVPDLPNPARKRLELLEMTQPALPIDILVDAPPEMAIRFDPWGGVIPDAWSGYPLNFEANGKNRIHVAADPADLACLVRELLPEDGTFDCGKTVIAAADPVLVPWIRRELENVPGMPEIYNPAGLPAGKLNLAPLLRLFCHLAEEPQINVVRCLFAHCNFINWLAEICGSTENDLLAALDAYRLEHPIEVLGPRAPSTNRTEALKKAFDEILKIRAELCSSTDPAKTLRELFSRIYSSLPPPLHGVSFQQEATNFSSLLEQFEKSPLLSELPAQNFYEALANAAEKTALYPEHVPDAVEITGFLDLPFRDAERIILCGMNEGVLPESIRPTSFLNDTKRKILGLPVDAQRFARDCFYLYTILKDAPRSEFIVCKNDEKETPLRPSTLFFAGSKNPEQRAGILFSPPPVHPDNAAPNSQSFGIQPDLSCAFGCKDNPEQIQLSVTSFKGLLDEKTLLDAFFSRSMKLTKNDYEATELDNLAFGTVCHAALEHFDVHSCSSEEEAVNTLSAKFSRELTQKCGSILPPAIQVQKEMFLRRIEHTAKKLFAEKDSFDLLKREWNLNKGEGILFKNILIKGKIDRIEISKDRKTLRLIDFKTSDSGESPEKTHYKKKYKEKPARFIDLQLPLYRLLLPLDEEFWQDEKVRSMLGNVDREQLRYECGYFNIPKAVTETGYSMWSGMEDLLDLAETAVGNAEKQIREKIRQNKLPRFKPDWYCDFPDFYRPDPKTAIRGIDWEDKNGKEAK